MPKLAIDRYGSVILPIASAVIASVASCAIQRRGLSEGCDKFATSAVGSSATLFFT